MLTVNKHLAMLIATIQALAVVVTYPGSSKSQDLPFSVVLIFSILTPKTYSNAEPTFISYHYIAAVFYSSGLLNVDLGQLANLSDDADCINCTHLFKVIYFVDRIEAKALSHDAGVVGNRLNGAIFVKDNAVVIFNACVLLVSHFYLTICESVNLIFTQIAVV